MAAATGSSGNSSLQSVFGSAIAAAALMLALSACQPAEHAAVQKRVEAKWVDRQLLFVGDARLGSVRVYHLRAAPQQIAELRAPGRNEVRDIALDPAANRIWVLGDGAVYLHDGRTFSLVKRIPAVGSGIVRLVLDASGTPLLIAENGVQLASIDPVNLLVQHRQLAGRDR